MRQIPTNARLLAYHEVVSVNADGTFNHGRTVLVPCTNGRPKLQPNAYTRGTMCATIKLGQAFVSVVVDPQSWEVRK